MQNKVSVHCSFKIAYLFFSPENKYAPFLLKDLNIQIIIIMKYYKKKYPIQKLPTGSEHAIVAHVFEGSQKGPKIYLQANLHGSEVFGAVLLMLLIEKLKKEKELKGSIVIVPVANPMGVNNTVYNSIAGRWNSISGKNWNRMFPSDIEWKDHKEEKEYFNEQLAKQNISVEEKLAATLRLLSTGADCVVDIHTTGSDNCPHLFTREDFSEDFELLGAKVHLLSSKEVFDNTFEESHVYPFRNMLSSSDIPRSCTWEVHHDGTIDKNMLEERIEQLQNWIAGVWGKSAKNVFGLKLKPKKFSSFENLKAPAAGYYVWTKKVGEDAAKGEEYAKVYLPQTASCVSVKAEFPFTLISTYGIGAIAEGEQVAWIGF